MCNCTPSIRTPFCGKMGCEWPEQSEMKIELNNIHFTVNGVEYIRLDYHRITVSKLEYIREKLQELLK